MAALFSVTLVFAAGGVGLPLQQQEVHATSQAASPLPTQAPPAQTAPVAPVIQHSWDC
jgi:hypothetical protein